MPSSSKRKTSRSKARGKQAAAADAMADCVLPSDIIVSILFRLPVKSIHRFKAVCKPWRKLFASPTFIKLHHAQFSQNPPNQNFLIYCVRRKPGAHHSISLFEMESDAEIPTDLVHPYPQFLLDMDFVGCLSGLVCLSSPVYGQWIHLWNPALNLVKHLPLPELDSWKDESGEKERVSVGFGYDDEAHDFKVVRIGALGGDKTKAGAEVFSTKTDSWREIKTGLKFRIFATKCGTVVGGNPYWIVRVDEDANDNNTRILWFDVKKSKFRMVRSLNVVLARDGFLVPLMDWKGSLAAVVVWEGLRFASVIVFDADKEMWKRTCLLGPIEMNVERCLQCSRSGKIVGSCTDGKLFVLDPWTGRVKVIKVEQAHKPSFKIFEYSESLVTVNKMKPVKVISPWDSKDEDDDGEDLAVCFCKQMQVLGDNNPIPRTF